MKIKQIEIRHIAIPMQKTFETSFGLIDKRPILLIAIRTDEGFVGYGESSPLYVPISESEILQDGILMLRKFLPQFIGKSFSTVDELLPIFQSFSGFPITKIGVEAALHHITAQAQNKPLYKYFGADSGTIEVGESIGIEPSVEATIKAAGKELSAGFRRIKLKIKPGHDKKIVQAVRAAFPDIPLGVDANAAYGSQHINDLAGLEEYNLLFIEQPFDADDFESNKILRKRCSIPVCLDETISDLASCKKAFEIGCVDIVNIKPARIGSFIETKKIHDYCVENNISLFGGGRLESGVGRFINASFYSLPGFNLPADLTPPIVTFGTDIISPPFLVENGLATLSLSTGPGIFLNDEVVKKYSKEVLNFE